MIALRYRHSDVTVTSETGAVNSNRAEERDHLRREHGLTKVDAWVAVTNATSEPECPKSGSAARMAKLRARKRDAGLVTMDVPAAIVTQVAAAGGWLEWRNSIEAAAILDEYQRMAAKWGMAPDVFGDVLARPSPWRRLILRLLG